MQATCRPRQQVTLGYWHQLIEQSGDEATVIIEHQTAVLAASAIPYLYIAGDDLPPGYRQWLAAHLPVATVEVWPRTGHFPHLAEPRQFARRLADTAQWAAR